jgi:hypothetical protein
VHSEFKIKSSSASRSPVIPLPPNTPTGFCSPSHLIASSHWIHPQLSIHLHISNPPSFFISSIITNMEDLLTSLMGGYHNVSPSKARKLHHLSHTPPEYWTAKERMLSGKARTRWLHEERKRAARGGSPPILDRIWPVGPYWPNGGVMPGGERRRREFREEVGRIRYREQEVSFLTRSSPRSIVSAKFCNASQKITITYVIILTRSEPPPS